MNVALHTTGAPLRTKKIAHVVKTGDLIENPASLVFALKTSVLKCGRTR